MKKFKFNKIHKILIIIIINVLIINIIYTYQDYQSAKNKPENQLPGKNLVMSINNNLGLNSFYEIIKSSLNIYTNNFFIAFDNSMTPFYNSNFTIENTIYYGSPDFSEEEKRLNIDNIGYQNIKDISNYIMELQNKDEKIIATFNYDAITDKDVILVNEITYFSIGDKIFIDNKKDNIISREITGFSSAFGYYGYSDSVDTYFDKGVSDSYDYLENNLKDIVNEKKFDHNGYYEITYSDESDRLKPIEYKDDNNDIVKINQKICFQKLDSKYGIYANNKYDEMLYSSANSETGYIAWFEYYLDGDLYTFTTYLFDNYLNYFTSLFLIIGSYFLIRSIVNKKTFSNPIDKPVIKQSKIKREIINKEEVDLEKQLSYLVSNGQNLFLFKNINLKFYSNPLIAVGNKNELIRVINDIFHFIIRHSTPNNNLSIKIEYNTIYFNNSNHTITKKDLEELNDILEILEAHDFKYHFDLDDNSYQITITI